MRFNSNKSLNYSRSFPKTPFMTVAYSEPILNIYIHMRTYYMNVTYIHEIQLVFTKL